MVFIFLHDHIHNIFFAVISQYRKEHLHPWRRSVFFYMVPDVVAEIYIERDKPLYKQLRLATRRHKYGLGNVHTHFGFDHVASYYTYGAYCKLEYFGSTSSTSRCLFRVPLVKVSIS